MTTREFSDGFDTLLNSYADAIPFGEDTSKRDIEVNEYEKSLLLTKAQEEIVTALYSGNSIEGKSFEETEELRRKLESLVKTATCTLYPGRDIVQVDPNSVLYSLPTDTMFITMEQVTYNDTCSDQLKRINVYPVKQDEYNKIKDNPFRGATQYKALRLDCGNKVVELISKYTIVDYIVRYLSKPTPIVLEDLPNGLSVNGESHETQCTLNSLLHNMILERAVLMALRVKGINTEK